MARIERIERGSRRGSVDQPRARHSGRARRTRRRPFADRAVAERRTAAFERPSPSDDLAAEPFRPFRAGQHDLAGRGAGVRRRRRLRALARGHADRHAFHASAHGEDRRDCESLRSEQRAGDVHRAGSEPAGDQRHFTSGRRAAPLSLRGRQGDARQTLAKGEVEEALAKYGFARREGEPRARAAQAPFRTWKGAVAPLRGRR